jgi:phosphoserine phosphatase RsbU/P
MKRPGLITPPVAASEQGRILVVDDNEPNRDMLSRRLRKQGYAVEVAADGRSALERIWNGRFDLVLLDIMMPELNGYEVLERLKSDETYRHLPVLMISAVDDMDSVVRCIELGADDYLPKPFNPSLLRARVEASLSRKRLHDRERLYARSLERELEIAREIQQGFLPAELPRLEGWEIAARFFPALQVAGDFYDVFVLPGGGVAMLIADVRGKGVGAALFMALFRSLIRAHAEQASARRGSGSTYASDVLIEAIEATNGYITRVHKSAHMFASVFLGVLEPATGALSYVNAGHLPPVRVAGGRVVSRLMPTGPAVGVLPAPGFESGVEIVEPGETVLAFTDGATEARNGHRELFSEERLLDLMSVASTPTAGALLDRIVDEIRAYTGGAGPADDLTLLAITREGVAGPLLDSGI